MENNLSDINYQSVVFTKHAKEKLEQHDIDEDIIVKIIQKPHQSKNVDDGKIEIMGKIMGNELYTVYKPIPEENKLLVITLWAKKQAPVKRNRWSERTTLPPIDYDNVKFTTHAKERMELRRIGETMIVEVMKKPQKTQNQDDESYKFIGKILGVLVYIVAKPLHDENKWLVITVWIRGEEDDGSVSTYKKYRKPKKPAKTPVRKPAKKAIKKPAKKAIKKPAKKTNGDLAFYIFIIISLAIIIAALAYYIINNGI